MIFLHLDVVSTCAFRVVVAMLTRPAGDFSFTSRPYLLLHSDTAGISVLCL
jgi:hypothetical protein